MNDIKFPPKVTLNLNQFMTVYINEKLNKVSPTSTTLNYIKREKLISIYERQHINT